MYDVIIIGAGMSGLAAGIRLAYFDRKVLICEQHTVSGGLNSYYRRQGRVLDVGLHAMTNYVSRKNRRAPLNKLLRQLKLKWDDFDLVEQNHSSIAFPDCSLSFSNDLALFKQEIAETFQSQVDSFVKLVEHIEEYDALNLQDGGFQSARKTLAGFISDPLLVEMLMCPLMYYGSAWEDDMDFSQFAIMFRSIFLEGFCRPRNGVMTIIKVLEDKYRACGGEVRFRSGVEKILVKNGRAEGVRLTNGEEIKAGVVLSSAGLCETGHLAGETVGAEEAGPGSMGFTEVILLLNKPLIETGYETTITFFNGMDRFSYRSPEGFVSLASGVICSPDNFRYVEDDRPDPILRITNMAGYRRWKDCSRDVYRQKKEEWLEKIIRRAIDIVPLDRDTITYTDMFTPTTVEKYTGHINGAVYGSPYKSKDGRTAIENLYVCGTDQGFLGIVGAMLSGISMANLHCLQD